MRALLERPHCGQFCESWHQASNPICTEPSPANYHMIHRPMTRFYVVLTILWVSGAWPVSLLAQNYNLKWGQARFNLTGRAGLAWDDNINYSQYDPWSDFISWVGLEVGSVYDINTHNRITFGIGAEYRKYFRHPQFDTSNNFLHLTPDTRLALTFQRDAVTVEASDRLYFTMDPTDAKAVDPETGQISGQTYDYGRFFNDAGLDLRWDFNSRWQALAGFHREDFIPLRSTFDTADRTRYILNAGLYHPVAADLTVGVNGSIFWNRYKIPFQNNSRGCSLALNARWQITDLTGLYSEIGRSWQRFDTGGSNGDLSDLGGFFWQIGLENNLTPVFSHNLNFERSYDYGFVSNFTTTDELRYGCTYDGINRVRLTGAARWRWVEDSGGLNSESYSYFLGEAGAAFQVTRRLSMEVRYLFSLRRSNLEGRDLEKNRVQVEAIYDF